MGGNNAPRASLTVVLVIFSILFLATATQTRASSIRTSALSDGSSSVQFSSWRIGSGSLLSQSSLAVGARSTRSLANNVGYTLNTAAVTNQSSYTFRPSRYQASNPVDYSYSYAAAAQRVRNPSRHHRRGGTNGGIATNVAAVPDTGTSLILFAIALGSFAALRVLPVGRSAAC
jgi:hypothetical protein